MKYIIVVEGYHDESKIKAVYPELDVVVTNGSEISKETLNLIKELSKNNEIVIFTDPDYPGERIRKKILELVPNAKQLFLRKKDCISNNNKKVGIEHASKELIKEALDSILVVNKNENNLTTNDLFDLGLIGSSNSAIIREKLADYLNLGKPNGKTILKRLNILGLNKNEVEALICKLK